MIDKNNKQDYRKFIIAKWSSSNILTFKEPSILELENQSKYYIQIINDFLPNIVTNKNINILEIGCGYGGFLYTLKKLGISNIDAIDIIPECCSFVSEVLKINTICIDVFDFFKKNNKKYDVIVAFDVLEHFGKDEIVTLLLLIYETLNDNGLFLMRVPNGGSLCGIYIRYSGFTHEIAFTPLSVNELFKAVGFKKVFCSPDKQQSTNLIKCLIRKFINKIIGKLFLVDSNFVNSPNIIAVGYK